MSADITVHEGVGHQRRSRVERDGYAANGPCAGAISAAEPGVHALCLLGSPVTTTAQDRAVSREPAALFWSHEKSFNWTRELIFERPKQHLHPSMNVATQFASVCKCILMHSTQNRYDLSVAADTSDLIVTLVVVVHPPAPSKPSIGLSASPRH